MVLSGKISMFIRFVALLSLFIAISSPAQSAPFLLHDGDTVVFYGDSITEQRLYTVYIAAAVHTQHPTWPIRFYNAGVGGDRVTGPLIRALPATSSRATPPSSLSCLA